MPPGKGQLIGEGISMTATPDEAAVIWEAVRAANLPETADGVLSLLLTYITGEVAEKENDEAAAGLGDLLRQHFENNPEHAEKVAALARSAGLAILKRLRT